MRHTGIAVTIALSFAVLGCGQTAAPADGLDQRSAVALPPVEFEAVHTEMRTMLTSLHQMHLGLATRDTAMLLQAAGASGLAAAADPELEPLLPPEFLRLGVETHTSFDRFAEAVRGGQPTDSLLAHLSRITAGCTTCHAQYRLAPGEQTHTP